MVAPGCAAGDPTCTDQFLSPMGPMRMARGVAKNFKNRVGSLAAKDSPTDAVTTADISLTVRAYDQPEFGVLLARLPRRHA
jgi:hypothetical protein